jgi:hypothetical protein
MTTKNTNILIGASGLITSKNFENNLISMLSCVDSDYHPKEVYLSFVAMERNSGYGSYNYVVEIRLDGEAFTLRKHTNDSESWDWYNDSDITNSTVISNWQKQTALMVIQDNLFNLEVMIDEEILSIAD